jgi:hypothetical protein
MVTYVIKIAKKTWFQTGDALKTTLTKVQRKTIFEIIFLYCAPHTVLMNCVKQTSNLYTAFIMYVNLQTALPSKFATAIRILTCI